jgi:hypothetical protein
MSLPVAIPMIFSPQIGRLLLGVESSPRRRRPGLDAIRQTGLVVDEADSGVVGAQASVRHGRFAVFPLIAVAF